MRSLDADLIDDGWTNSLTHNTRTLIFLERIYTIDNIPTPKRLNMRRDIRRNMQHNESHLSTVSFNLTV
jgi:hypothetical protein